MATLLCPHCQHPVGTIDAGLDAQQTLVRGAIDAGAKIASDARIEANRRAGLARVAKAARKPDGTFMSNAEIEERNRRYAEWLYAVPGRAGGVERDLFANRDEFGRFASDRRLTP